MIVYFYLYNFDDLFHINKSIVFTFLNVIVSYYFYVNNLYSVNYLHLCHINDCFKNAFYCNFTFWILGVAFLFLNILCAYVYCSSLYCKLICHINKLNKIMLTL